jgi:DNA-binding response OmpR family regulator
MGLRVLIVEDEHEIRRMSARALEQAGYQVLQADGAAEALHMSRTNAVDVLLTDTNLGAGHIDGFELAQLVLREHRGIPVIVIFSDSQNCTKAGELGMGSLAKPFSPDGMVRCVGEALGGSGRKRSSGAGQV